MPEAALPVRRPAEPVALGGHPDRMPALEIRPGTTTPPSTPERPAMRPLWLLLTAVTLAIVGAYPSLARLAGTLVMATIGLALHGAALLLAQTAIKVLVLAVGAVWLVQQRRTA